MWRVVRAGLGTYTEICEHWDIVDLFEANCVLNAFDYAESHAQAASKAKSSRS